MMRKMVNVFVDLLLNAREFQRMMTRIQESKLEDQLRGVLRRKQYSLKTEETYVGWYRRYVLWHGKRHPLEMGAAEVESFLAGLATKGRVAAPTQNDSHASPGVSRPAGCLSAVSLAATAAARFKRSMPCYFSIVKCSKWTFRV